MFSRMQAPPVAMATIHASLGTVTTCPHTAMTTSQRLPLEPVAIKPYPTVCCCVATVDWCDCVVKRATSQMGLKRGPVSRVVRLAHLLSMDASCYFSLPNTCILSKFARLFFSVPLTATGREMFCTLEFRRKLHPQCFCFL